MVLFEDIRFTSSIISGFIIFEYFSELLNVLLITDSETLKIRLTVIDVKTVLIEIGEWEKLHTCQNALIAMLKKGDTSEKTLPWKCKKIRGSHDHSQYFE